MVKIKLNAKIYEGKEIDIRKGRLYVDGKDMGVIGYECSCVTLEGTFDQSAGPDGILRWR
jgi:hypothetical protein